MKSAAELAEACFLRFKTTQAVLGALIGARDCILSTSVASDACK